ncbi:hypothetical protein SO802_028603 [Lithocarpus litseifolius]|uniref:Uncharacterized protein n=1 Tax=Lithocarpus litseifolius TaxID=425828 RepID=A0AAW2BTW0_9ROSI
MSMPCLNMFNTEKQGLCPPSVHPRISFSNDFADVQQPSKHDNIYREAPVSSDFEFSVKNYTMAPADEVFFQGMLLPVKNSCTNNQQRKMTLRDELSVDDDYEDVFPRISKNGSRWRERLGLKKGISASKKCDKSGGMLESVVEEKSNMFVHEDSFVSKKTQELFFEALKEG